jgi:hypothetical protein
MITSFSAYQIISALDRLGIKHEREPNHKGWLSVLCPNPMHNDHDFGNCSVNVNSGFVKCFSCGYGSKGESRKTIIDVVKDNLSYSFKEAKQFIEEGFSTSFIQPIQIEAKPKKVRIRSELVSFDFNPDDFLYTKSRGFSKSFVKEFNIKLAYGGWFDDYMLIPIVDSAKNINEHEGRKLKEYETLCNFYGDATIDYDKLKNNFKKLCERNDVKLNRKNYKVYINGVVSEDPQLFYLIKPKTLYDPNSLCQETLWNIDNLDSIKSLYIVEGCGSVPKIYENITTNVTSIFGVSITDAQIEYLNKFPEVIHIPDYDVAGYNSVDFLNKNLKTKYSIIDTKYEDTADEYLKSLATATKTPEQYLVDHIYDFRITLKR